MRYFISFTILLFCSSSAFSQVKADTAILVPKEPAVDTTEGIKTNCRGNNKQFIAMLSLVDSSVSYKNVKITPSRKLYCNITNMPPMDEPKGIVHVNHTAFGLPIYAFRFENVNQMANAVAGVFSIDGETPSILGARREGTAYYFNEVRVLEGFLPETLQ